MVIQVALIATRLKMNVADEGGCPTGALAGIEHGGITEQKQWLRQDRLRGTHSLTRAIFDPMVAVVRFQKRAQGRVYSSISGDQDEFRRRAFLKIPARLFPRVPLPIFSASSTVGTSRASITRSLIGISCTFALANVAESG